MPPTGRLTNRLRASYASLAAKVTVAHNEPNGININAQCGSTHPQEIQRLVKEAGATVGITHDGDADRVLLCDEKGALVDGDEILAIAAVDLLKSKQLRSETLVATVMSNSGLDETIQANGGKVVRTKVGGPLRDRGNDEAKAKSRRGTKRPHHFWRLRDDW